MSTTIDPGEQELANIKTKLEIWRSKEAVDAVQYDSKAFSDAHEKFQLAPETLTDTDLQQFEVVCPELAKEASLRRDGYKKDWMAGLSDEQKKLWTSPITLKFLMKHEADYWGPILLSHRHKHTLLENDIARLSRLLDLACKQVEEQQALLNVLLWQREQEAAKP